MKVFLILLNTIYLVLSFCAFLVLNQFASLYVYRMDGKIATICLLLVVSGLGSSSAVLTFRHAAAKVAGLILVLTTTCVLASGVVLIEPEAEGYVADAILVLGAVLHVVALACAALTVALPLARRGQKYA